MGDWGCWLRVANGKLKVVLYRSVLCLYPCISEQRTHSGVFISVRLSLAPAEGFFARKLFTSLPSACVFLSNSQSKQAAAAHTAHSMEKDKVRCVSDYITLHVIFRDNFMHSKDDAAQRFETRSHAT